MRNPFKVFWDWANSREIRVVRARDGKELDKKKHGFSVDGIELACCRERAVQNHGGNKSVNHPTDWFADISTSVEEDGKMKEKVDTHFVLLNDGLKKVIVITKPKV